MNLWPQVKYVTQQNVEYVEDIIYETKNGRSTLGESPIILSNTMQATTNDCLTIVKNKITGEIKNSYNITKVIGQCQYNTILTALLSVINPELRLKAILALLTNQEMNKNNVSTQTDDINDFNNSDMKTPTRKIKKRKLEPYVVLDDNIKVRKEDVSTKHTQDIDITTLVKSKNIDTDQTNIDDNSISFGNLSVLNCSEFSFRSDVFNLDFNIDNENIIDSTKYCLKLNDGESLMLPAKPEDIFHLATPETLRGLSPSEARKLIVYQKYIDCSRCLERDEDNCLPIHNAIVNMDTAVIWRHCVVLKSLVGTVDVEIDDGLTPLHLALQQSNIQAAAIFLHHGADVIRTDASERCALHHATNQDMKAVELLEKYCKDNAREILSKEPEIWNEELAKKSDRELASYLCNLLGSMFDSHGYTPLMLAARAGWNDTAAALLSLAPESLNVRSSVAGETALYLAVTAAISQAQNNGTKSAISTEYINTIKVLMTNGADPKIENRSGLNLLNLLSLDYNYPEISLIVNSGRNEDLTELPKVQSLLNCMLIRKNSGEVHIEQVIKVKPSNRVLEKNRNRLLNVKINKKVDTKIDTQNVENAEESVKTKAISNKIDKTYKNNTKIYRTYPNLNNSNVNNEKHKTSLVVKDNIVVKCSDYRHKLSKFKILPLINRSKTSNNSFVLLPQKKTAISTKALNSKKSLAPKLSETTANYEPKKFFILKDGNKTMMNQNSPKITIISNEKVQINDKAIAKSSKKET